MEGEKTSARKEQGTKTKATNIWLLEYVLAVLLPFVAAIIWFRRSRRDPEFHSRNAIKLIVSGLLAFWAIWVVVSPSLTDGKNSDSANAASGSAASSSTSEKSGFDMADLDILLVLYGVPAIYMLGAGVLGLKQRKKLHAELRQREQRVKRYTDAMRRNPNATSREIAAEFNLPIDQVNNEIAELAESGVWGEVYLNLKTGRLTQLASIDQAVDPSEKVSVFCPSCGGNNEVAKGGTAHCYFCGAKLSGTVPEAKLDESGSKTTASVQGKKVQIEITLSGEDE